MGQIKHVLVAGGAGFIGLNLIQKLLNTGHHVICLDNFISSHEEAINDIEHSSNLEILEHDIIQPVNIKVDAIYNLACAGSPKRYQDDPIHTLRTSVYGVDNLSQLALKNQCPMFHSSTSEIYGEPMSHPQKETDWGNVNTLGIRACYDEGKRAAEALLYDYQRRYKLDIRVARVFNTYGPKMHADDGRVVSNFINQALRSEPITIFGEGQQTRSLCYIDDLIIGIQKMMALPVAPNTPINLGNSDEYSIKQIAERISKVLNKELTYEYHPLPQDDPTRRNPDISLAKSLLDWSPQTSMTEGLEKTIHYFQSQL
jgi:UDP-glucuronate decarboxylase